jgi:hypothetical protein
MSSSHKAREGPAEGTIGPTAEPEEAGTLNQRPARAANAQALSKVPSAEGTTARLNA